MPFLINCCRLALENFRAAIELHGELLLLACSEIFHVTELVVDSNREFVRHSRLCRRHARANLGTTPSQELALFAALLKFINVAPVCTC